MACRPHSPLSPIPDRARAELLRLLEQGRGGRYRGSDYFRFFLAAGLTRLGIHKMDKIPDDARDDINAITDLYFHLVRTLPAFEDILGPLYMELASHGQKDVLGQYFTDPNIATMMCLMLVDDALPDDGRLIRSCDPASGSGAMMLMFCRTILERFGVDALVRVSVTCCDLDRYCSHMSALQHLANLAVRNWALGELIVMRGNSLLPETDMEVVVHATHARFPVNEVPPALHPRRLEALKEAAGAAGVGEQIGLFEDDEAA